MKGIGIASPFNPYELREYLYVEDIPYALNNNVSATSVHTMVKGLLKLNCHVIIFSTDLQIKKTVHLRGELLDIYLIPRRFYKMKKFTSFDGKYMAGRLKRVIGEHILEISVLHAQWTYEYAYASLSYADKIPVFCTVRDWCPYLRSKAFSLREKLHWNIYWGLFKKVLSDKNIHFIANSKYTQTCVANYWGNSHYLPIIPNPISEEYIIEKRHTYPEHPVFVSIANSLTEVRKNLYNLLLAFREYRKECVDSSLWLIGKYDEKETVIKQWKEQGLLEGVTLLGFLDHNELIKVLDRASVLVHPSLEETFGNILIEGMARKLVVVGGERAGAVPSVLGCGRFGYLCDVTQPMSIYVTLRNIVANWTNSLNVVEAATYNLLETYCDRTVALKHLSLYKESIANNY